MKRLHILFSLSSLAVILVSIERFSFTTHVLLQPYDFLRLHEAVQITVLILATVIIPFFVLKEVTHDFSLLTQGSKRNGYSANLVETEEYPRDLPNRQKNLFMAALFIAGIYFYASGNAYHELASFLLNQYCDPTHTAGLQCQGMFFNDYYIGNGLYFVGALLMTIIPILFEVAHPRFLMKRSDFFLLIPNVLFYALGIIAYAGFDRVLVGLVWSLATMLVVLAILFIHRKEAKRLPVTSYTALIYVIATIVSCIIRFVH